MITYVSGGRELLDEVEPLWIGLREHHKVRSEHFRNEFENISFDIRKKMLEDKAYEGSVLVEVAEDSDTGKAVAYCISSVNRLKQGELESIFVEAEYRGRGIGDRLIKRSIDWMDEAGAYAKVIAVVTGNEKALGFYARYGFLPRQYILKQIR